MGNYEELKAAVASVIKANGNQKITGQVLQNTLTTLISQIGVNATFAGIATPSTAPGTPDQNVFYIAEQSGTYPNFNSIVLDNEIAILSNKSGTWVKTTTGFATNDCIGNETAGKLEKSIKKGQRFNFGRWSLSRAVDKSLAINSCIKILEQLTKVHYFLVNANVSIYFAMGI